MNVRKKIKIVFVGKSFQWTLIRSIILGVCCFGIFRFLLLPVWIKSGNMEPTYRNNNLIFVNTLRYRYSKPSRGDIVAIKMAGPKVMLIQRIVGLPGESIAFRDGALIINGKTISEEYVKGRCDWNMSEVKVAKDEFFVVGDNRQIPFEMYALGRVKHSKIAGSPLPLP